MKTMSTSYDKFAAEMLGGCVFQRRPKKVNEFAAAKCEQFTQLWRHDEPTRHAANHRGWMKW